MDKKTKQALLVTVCGVALFALLMNFSTVSLYMGKLLSLFMPVIVGGILAIFINVPVAGIEKRLSKIKLKNQKTLSENACHLISFIITLLCTVAILIIVCTLIIPELTKSVQSLYSLLQSKIPVWLDYLNSHNMNYKWLEDFISSININTAGIVNNLSQSAEKLFGGVVNVVSSTINVVTTSAFAIIIAIYSVLGKSRICRHSKTLVTAYLKPSWSEKIIRFCSMFSETFAKFLSSQCVEAVILGALMFIVFSIFKIPYALLIGILTAVCAIIPYIGAFLSCALSTLLIAIISPMLALKGLVIYLVVQFVENQFIYPRVVGGTVGLPPLYTLIAAMIGGKLFGITGILFFIPLMAVILTLAKEGAQKRLETKNSKQI